MTGNPKHLDFRGGRENDLPYFVNRVEILSVVVLAMRAALESVLLAASFLGI